MTDPIVIQDDIERFLTGYIRREIRQPSLLAKYPMLDGFEVSNREPAEDSGNFPAKLIVVRDDGNAETGLLVGAVAVGVTVLMGGVEDLSKAKEAARVVHAIVRGCARVEANNPVAAVGDSNGPYAVPENQPRARLYSTHELTTVGSAL